MPKRLLAEFRRGGKIKSQPFRRHRHPARFNRPRPPGMLVKPGLRPRRVTLFLIVDVGCEQAPVPTCSAGRLAPVPHLLCWKGGFYQAADHAGKSVNRTANLLCKKLPAEKQVEQVDLLDAFYSGVAGQRGFPSAVAQSG
jgi:hypothetical protein